ncbi:PEP-CTERM sorting domain-containing protein [Pseudoduganella plicata]|uniref:PEP-CTERM sorting domain-containing protein n=1 Tax=Pseudoduganella plicata TaxID=321984 RepID=A0A4P7BI89_9BURK|nr:PEP-CTERM sorting domain-containing protein [Pseudoduganella plicata]QBQ38591.1 PEP-CTERM sorting domain-containing protein [Pseudoduganella plicata]GGY83363.1 hypothetical protein GCM10007388_15480 [Pseudoduganella plicata]
MPAVHPSRTPINAAILAVTLALSASAGAAPFTINGAVTTGQLLGPGSGQVGTVSAGASLTTTGGTVAVTISGNDAVLNNLGTIEQTGSGRAIRDNKGVTGLVINNASGALIRTADADVIQVNVATGTATLNNYGTLLSQNASAGGAQAVDFSAMTGANAINNFAGGTMSASEADAVRPGANGTLFNAGTIRSLTATGASSDGIDGQDNSGIRVTNAATGLVSGARHGITAEQASAGVAFTLAVTNASGGTIRGNSGSGINVDGFNARQVVTVVNDGAILGNGVTGDGDGVDVDGLVDITNRGVIRSLNAYSDAGSGPAFSEGISAGGGKIVNAGIIEGLTAAGNRNAVGRGITLAGNDIASGPLAGTREGLYGNTTIVNQAGGLIRGQSDAAIFATGAASGFTVTVNNHAGATIQGGGAQRAAIQGGADNTFIYNAGAIDGSSSGKAIALGGGVNTVTVNGGNASIVGAIDGGSGAANTMIVDAGAGNTFAYAGAISGFASVELRSGAMTLTGQSTYTGSTLLGDATLTLVGANRIDAASALVMAGGTLDLTGAAAQTFASLALTGDATIVLGQSALTFNGLAAVSDGASLTVLDDEGTPGYAFRLLGNYAGNATFLDLMRATTVDAMAVTYSFDGTYTNVQAVPEPATAAMLLGGLAVLTSVARRRKARSMTGQ